MKQQIITSPELPHPKAVYSQAVKAGNFIFVAGQAGVDFKTGIVSEDIEKQARQAFENLALVLQVAGSSMEQVVKTTVWLRDADHFDILNELYAEYFPTNPPARSTPIVGLPKSSLKISIEAVSIVNP